MSLSAAALALHFPNRVARPADLAERKRCQSALLAMARTAGQLVHAGTLRRSDVLADIALCCIAMGLPVEPHVEPLADALDAAAEAADIGAQRRIEAAILPLIGRRRQSVEIFAAARHANADAIPDAECVAIVKDQIRAALAADRRRSAARG